MGDSITEGWKLDQSFPGKSYINRGIGGQTTPQMLVRFREDVIDLKPKVVIILAGTNDIAGNTGPMTLDETEGNIASMAELAATNGIRVVISSVLPAYDYSWAPGLEPAPKIVEVNEWLKKYAADKGYIVDPEKVVFMHTAVEPGRLEGLAGSEPVCRSASGSSEKCAKKLRGASGSSWRQPPGQH